MIRNVVIRPQSLIIICFYSLFIFGVQMNKNNEEVEEVGGVSNIITIELNRMESSTSRRRIDVRTFAVLFFFFVASSTFIAFLFGRFLSLFMAFTACLCASGR